MPETMETKEILLRLPPELVAKIDRLAADEERSRNGWIRRILRRAAEQATATEPSK